PDAEARLDAALIGNALVRRLLVEGELQLRQRDGFEIIVLSEIVDEGAFGHERIDAFAGGGIVAAGAVGLIGAGDDDGVVAIAVRGGARSGTLLLLLRDL